MDISEPTKTACEACEQIRMTLGSNIACTPCAVRSSNANRLRNGMPLVTPFVPRTPGWTADGYPADLGDAADPMGDDEDVGDDPGAAAAASDPLADDEFEPVAEQGDPMAALWESLDSIDEMCREMGKKPQDDAGVLLGRLARGFGTVCRTASTATRTIATVTDVVAQVTNVVSRLALAVSVSFGQPPVSAEE